MRNSTRLVVLGRKFDTDAQDYIRRVEVADNAALEEGVKLAINNFVVGCKVDGIWNAIKASCILAGARTLAGALVPLVGTAPTNFNFVSADYNRKVGLVGNESTKYLDSNRPANFDPTSNMHLAVSFHSGSLTSTTRRFMGAYSGPGTADDFLSSAVGVNYLRCRSAAPEGTITFNLGLYGVSRSSPNSFSIRVGGNNFTGLTATAVAPGSRTHFIFGQNDNGTAYLLSSNRIAFYSIGESLDLALLDARVNGLINAYNTAIV